MTELTLLPMQKGGRGGATFDKVENPGGWSRLSYVPVFVSGSQVGQYNAHCLPSGFQPVPPDGDDATIRTTGGCIFSAKGGRRVKTRMG